MSAFRGGIGQSLFIPIYEYMPSGMRSFKVCGPFGILGYLANGMSVARIAPAQDSPLGLGPLRIIRRWPDKFEGVPYLIEDGQYRSKAIWSVQAFA